MKSITLISLAALGVFSLYGNAYAENGHAYNGSYCDAYFGSQAGDFNHRFNGIRNNASSGRYVSCPVIVDEINNTAGTTRVWLHYTGSGTVSCTLFSMRGNGTSLQSKTKSRVNTGGFQIPDITSDDFWGSYSMYCLLPAKGILNTIWVGEKN